MEESKNTPAATQGEVAAPKKKGQNKPATAKEVKAKEDLQPNSEHSVGQEGKEKVEKDVVTDPASLNKSESAEAQEAKADDARKEADKILKAAAKGTESVKCSHKAAVLAINSPGVVFDNEEKILSYGGGKTKLVIE